MRWRIIRVTGILQATPNLPPGAELYVPQEIFELLFDDDFFFFFFFSYSFFLTTRQFLFFIILFYSRRETIFLRFVTSWLQ